PDSRWLACSYGVLDADDGHFVKGRDAFKDTDWNNAGGEMYGVAFSRNGKRLASVSPQSPSILSIWGEENWRLLDKAEVTSAQLIGVSFSPDGNQLVTGDDEGAVRLWSVTPLKEIAVIGRHASRLKSVAFSPDGKEVASAGDDRTIKLWSVEDRRLITEIGRHTSRVLSVSFSPDCKRIASGEEDNTVNLYTRHNTLLGYRLN